jgi:SAM-dependent methyltransferase
VTEPPPPGLRAQGPFDLVVAGEIIEHLGAPQALLEFARGLLRPGGQLLLTTPNPFALWRARAGQIRLVWESVDHATYMFPSGIAEMASRTGMVLRTCTTVDHRDPRIVRGAAFQSPAIAALRRARRKYRHHRDQEPVGRFGLGLPTTYLSPPEWLLHSLRRTFGQLGETSIYLLERAGTGPS